jgi:hypothetical protein
VIGLNLVEAPAKLGRFLGGHPSMLVELDRRVRHGRLFPRLIAFRKQSHPPIGVQTAFLPKAGVDHVRIASPSSRHHHLVFVRPSFSSGRRFRQVTPWRPLRLGVVGKHSSDPKTNFRDVPVVFADMLWMWKRKASNSMMTMANNFADYFQATKTSIPPPRFQQGLSSTGCASTVQPCP